MKPDRQQGAALITVLLIVTLATTLAAYVAQQQSFWQRQAENLFAHAQARRIGIAGIDWARAVLADDAAAGTTDHERELWTARLPAVQVEGGEITGFIEDRQGLFNLNNLVRDGATSPRDVAQFRRLLTLLGLPGNLADAASDWMDDDSAQQQPGGAEDAYYLALAPPYRAANRPLAELAELEQVQGYDRATIARLQPYVSVLPQATRINANFAPPEVLAAVLETMTLADARMLVSRRAAQPFTDIEDFKQRLPRGGINGVEKVISVSSQYFQVTGRARIGDAVVTTRALLRRNAGSNWPTVIWQSMQ